MSEENNNFENSNGEPQYTQASEQPVYTEPVPEQPVYTNPTPDQPVYTNPTPDQTSYTNPTPNQQGYGQPVYNQPVNNYGATGYNSGKGKSNGFGIASMVCGILALITCCLWCTVIPLAIVSIVLGILQIVKNESKGMAIAGIVCSAIALFLFILFFAYGKYMETTGVYNEFYNELYDILNQYSY